MINPEHIDDFKLDDKDAVLYMMYRRTINGDYADQPVEFNVTGLEAGELVLDRPYSADDVIADIGSSSGEIIAEAAIETRIPAKIVCVEPSEDAYENNLRLPDNLRHRISFIRGTGEHLPLKDNSLVGLTLHNVIFRAEDPTAMLTEAKRAVIPDGFIAISSNAFDHAFYRHQFERKVAEKVMEIAKIKFAIPDPPAAGHYLEDLPELIKDIGGLDIIDDLFVSQDTYAAITRGSRLDDYIESIKFSAANTDLPDAHRTTWRKVVEFWVRPFIEKEISEVEDVNRLLGIEAEPYFADPIRRGMFVMRNNK